MSRHNLPEAHHGQAPTPRTNASLMRFGPGMPPLHSPRSLIFKDHPGREHWWELLGAGVRQRVAEKVGDRIEWWAYCGPDDTDKPYAVVFGARGLAVTRPTINKSNKPAHLVRVWKFKPSSIGHKVIAQEPSRLPASGGPEAREVEIPQGLNERMCGFLGNLPPEAQQRLQSPFCGGNSVQDADFFCYGTMDRRLDVWCYLAGPLGVRFLSGRRDAVPGIPDMAAWHLMP